MNRRIPLTFVGLGLIVLLFGAFMGILAGIVHIEPNFLKETLPFNQLRGIHVSSMISWLILCATGGVYYYVTIELDHSIYSGKMATFHLILFLCTGLGIYLSLFSGKMGGREYMTFLPVLILPVVLGWVVFGINYFKTLPAQTQKWPVYFWMWGTGIVFMTYHLAEANLWIFDHFRGNFIRDLTVQWKSYGSFTGSWNMLIYGTAIFLMARIKGDDNIGRKKLSFFFYFLGLTNLMFGWAHHVYPVPNEAWLRGLAYAISMSEWLVLGYMLTDWIKSLSTAEKVQNPLVYRMLLITDVWVFLNVLLALLISIPAINHYTHGTHITVAHSMGTTIGINTTILLASAMFILSRIRPDFLMEKRKTLLLGTSLFNISLIVFLVSLMMAGLRKGQWMYGDESSSYSIITEQIAPYMKTFVIAGIGLFTGLVICVIPLIRAYFTLVTKKA